PPGNGRRRRGSTCGSRGGTKNVRSLDEAPVRVERLGTHQTFAEPRGWQRRAAADEVLEDEAVEARAGAEHQGFHGGRPVRCEDRGAAATIRRDGPAARYHRAAVAESDASRRGRVSATTARAGRFVWRAVSHA